MQIYLLLGHKPLKHELCLTNYGTLFFSIRAINIVCMLERNILVYDGGFLLSIFALGVVCVSVLVCFQVNTRLNIIQITCDCQRVILFLAL